MKYLYLATKKLDGYCNPESKTVDDFIFENKRIFCTRLEEPGLNTVRFGFILNTYNIDKLLVNIHHNEIELFLDWLVNFYFF